ncbi:MAG: hypothetical protein EON93_23815, partial [Burkholderiales bacterium]
MNFSSWKKVLRSTAAPVALVVTSLASPALAQTEAVEPVEEAKASEGIVVTGTRVARPGFQSPNPLTVL